MATPNYSFEKRQKEQAKKKKKEDKLLAKSERKANEGSHKEDAQSEPESKGTVSDQGRPD